MKSLDYETLNQVFLPETRHSSLSEWMYNVNDRVSSAFQTLVTWNRRAAMRQNLLEMSPRMLKDMGMTLEQAMTEAEKPFWRE